MTIGTCKLKQRKLLSWQQSNAHATFFSHRSSKKKATMDPTNGRRTTEDDGPRAKGAVNGKAARGAKQWTSLSKTGSLEIERGGVCQVASPDPTFCPHEHVDPHPLCCVVLTTKTEPCSIHPSMLTVCRERGRESKLRKEGVRLVCRRLDGRTVLPCTM